MSQPQEPPYPGGPQPSHPDPAPHTPSAHPTGEAPPTRPDPAAAPAYPGSETPPAYPGAETPHTHPSAQPPPAYPSSETPPAYPGAQPPPAYPGSETPPAYPGSGTPPAYPGAQTRPHPGSGTPPIHPHTQTPPPYPGSATPHTHPGAPPPSSPGPHTPPPQYPGAPQSPAHHALPGPAHVPTPPAAPPGTPASAHPGAPAPQPLAPDTLDYQNALGSRVHYLAHQRGADATALGRLALLLPGFLMSLLVVVLAASILTAVTGLPYWIPTLLWVASGALVFHRPSEDLFARRLLKLHRPSPQDMSRLAPVWREVTARAGVDGSQYELWIEESKELNAYAAAGHIVGVTRFALTNLTSAHLAAVLAHELGHHTGGHAWSSLLDYWYSLPGRVAWRVIRAVMVFTVTFTSYFSWLVTAGLVLFFGFLTLATVTVLYGLPLILLAIPYLMAAVGRRAELRADQHAAALGFAPMLAEVLYAMEQSEVQARYQLAAARGAKPAEPGVLARLLTTHPDFHTRLYRLQPHLQGQR
ncbi:M48 family metalloprotease [Streptomyces sp. NBC_00237]|uniref:M48 family metalloprotease n=1 Tax=Streptomyces sp. NBC_00237 TaxID=2975687 RepID=UPI00224D0A72|nr:M48 family metalloprotease [Streptomyces sp. NBC_00237]MCX5204847.1 M48 family metalloprotease [Streptomyces sp. NBC_00237]